MAVSKELMCNDVFAEPMIERDGFLDSYVAKLNELRENRSLPDLKKEMAYRVYSVRGHSYGAHKSIVLSSDDERFFTVELGLITVDGKKHIYPVTRTWPASEKEKLKYHGTIEKTGLDLISTAIGTMKKFGKYFKYCNNCQNYCNYYMEAIGLEKQISLTDGDKTTLLAVIGGIVTVLFALLK